MGTLRTSGPACKSVSKGGLQTCLCRQFLVRGRTFVRPRKSTRHPHKIDDQHRSCVALRGFSLRGFWGVRGFSLLRWEKGSETPSCGGKKGLRLPRSSCSDLGSEGVSDHRKKGKPRTSQNPLSENPLSATNQSQVQNWGWCVVCLFLRF